MCIVPRLLASKHQIMHQLVQLVYVSRATALGACARGQMLKQARSDNARRQLTGMLISLGDLYVQALEGEAGMVKAVFNTIARDQRHSQVTPLFVRPIPDRIFLPWRLGYWEGGGSALPMSIEDIDASAAERLLRQGTSTEFRLRRSRKAKEAPKSQSPYPHDEWTGTSPACSVENQMSVWSSRPAARALAASGSLRAP